METLLVKIFATALTLSQMTTAPEAIALQFDRVRIRRPSRSSLCAGRTHMRTPFAKKIEHAL
jgi:hypothetical protein